MEAVRVVHDQEHVRELLERVAQPVWNQPVLPQLPGPRRVAGVGRPTFGFHTAPDSVHRVDRVT